MATIEPIAIRIGLPLNTEFGDSNIAGLESELQKPQYQSALVFIAWEHGELDQFTKNILQDNGGDPTQVPSWPESDYDTIFLVKLTYAAGAVASIAFSIDHEGLNNQLSASCP